MKTILFLNADLHANVTLNLLLPVLEKHNFRFYLSESVGKKKTDVLELEQVSFLEKACLFRHIFPEAESRPAENRFLTFREIAEKYRAGGEIITDLASEKTKNEVKNFEADWFFSVRFGKIFRDDWFKMAKNGIINLHSSLLPDYKGVMGVFRAFQFREEKFGFTVHSIDDSSIDTGRIFGQEAVKLRTGRSIFGHLCDLYPAGAARLTAFIRAAESGQAIDFQAQKPGGTYFSFPAKKDFEEMKAGGFPLFDRAEYAALIREYYGIEEKRTMEFLEELPKTI